MKTRALRAIVLSPIIFALPVLLIGFGFSVFDKGIIRAIELPAIVAIAVYVFTLLITVMLSLISRIKYLTTLKANLIGGCVLGAAFFIVPELIVGSHASQGFFFAPVTGALGLVIGGLFWYIAIKKLPYNKSLKSDAQKSRAF